MKATDYTKMSGLALARLLKAGKVSPLEVMDAAIERAEQVNPRVNALVYTDYELARSKAKAATLKGTFQALPFLLKDSGLGHKELRSSLGSRLFRDMQTQFTGTLTERFEADGLIPFGRTAVPEFSMAPTTEAIQNGGPTRNPWNESHSAGGSSGGAAAAVATGILPIAHASDGGGSIRIPASCCGLYGLKPSRGLVPAGPMRGEGWGGLATDGVLSRCVRDTAAALDGIAGMELGAPYAAPPQPGSYLHAIDKPFDRPLKIAKWTQGFEGIEIHSECLQVLSNAEALLKSLGHEVVEAPLPPIQFGKFVKAQIEVMAANVTASVNGKVRNDLNSGWENLLEPAILDAYKVGKSLTAEAYSLAITRFHTVGRQMAVYLSDYDFVLTPTLMQPPAQLGVISTNDDFVSFRTKVSRYATFCAIVNASGQPAANIPLHRSGSGLPIGVQLIAPFGNEAELLRISAQLEEASPWSAEIALL